MSRKRDSIPNVQYMAVSEIVPYENNPRLNDASVDYVANSIKEFGFKQPIVVDKDMVIIAGHTRWKAAKKLGLKEVPVIVADDLSPEQANAYRLADNKVGEFSLWDFDKLDLELGEIEFDMSDFGFRTQEFEWNDVEGISEENYSGTAEVKLVCPACGHCGLKQEFKRASDGDN